MTLTIAVTLLKGGCSKTSTSLAIAEAAAAQTVPVVVLDADPMGGALRWSQLAAASGHPLRSQVLPRATPDLDQHFRSDTRDAAVVVIDCPPGRLDIIGTALDVADLLVMPVQPGAADLDRIMATAKLAAERSLPATAVLVQVRARVADVPVAADTLKGWGVALAATRMPMAVAIQRMYGEPVTGRLLQFGSELLDELLEGELGAS